MVISEKCPLQPNLRFGGVPDLPGVNRLIGAAVMDWDLPERVKRLSLPSYRYSEQDLQHLSLLVAEHANRGLVGVAAWEPADPADVPGNGQTLLLHGLYVLPKLQRGGIGSRLVERVERIGSEKGFEGLLVKAQIRAAGFFRALGMTSLPVRDSARDYPHRFWKPLSENPF